VSLELLDTATRAWLAASGAACLALAFGLRRRAGVSRFVAPAAALGLVLLGTVGGERLLAFVAARAAPDTADFNEYHWRMLAPWGRFGLALGGATTLAIVALGIRASRRVASPWRRAAAIGLRTGAAAAALVLFLEPALELRQVAREPNRIAILVDGSASMQLRDDPTGPTRAARARAILDASAASFDTWSERHQLDVYQFGDSLEPTARDAAATTDPRGRASLLREALEQLRGRYEGRDLAGVVVLSDGIATGAFAGGASDPASVEFLRSLDTKVHAVWTGASGLKDVAVADVLVDEFAFVRTAVKIEVVVRATGYPRRRIPITLSRDDEVVRQAWIEIGPRATDVRVTFSFTPNKVGKFVYTVSTPVSDDEAVTSNNTRELVLRVIRDKIRVLQVAGEPSWDVRSLRRMLKQNPNVDLISFFILRTGEDLQPVPQEEMSLIPFPTRELFGRELPSFDVIVLQNFNFDPYGIGAYLENIRAYVEGGGGLVMLGGPVSFSSGLYAGTPVARALPVDLLPNFLPAERLLDSELFAPRLTRTGESHPIAALRYETADNRAAWRSLPELEGVNIIGAPRPGATVIAEHPALQLAAGKPLPIIVAGDHGEGRSLVITTDSLWRWGMVAAGRPGDDGRAYSKLWENAIRWLIRDPDLQYLRAQSDATEYYAEQPIRIDVRALDRDYTALAGATVALDVRPIGPRGDGDTVDRAELTTDDAGEAQRHLTSLEPGVYRATARARVGDRPVEAIDLFLVRNATQELERPAASPDLLQQIASATGGRFLADTPALPADLEFAAPRVVRVDRRADVELWSRPWLLLAALLLLGLEWGLRQRSGYL
jgi:uncharacterized membrane protein